MAKKTTKKTTKKSPASKVGTRKTAKRVSKKAGGRGKAGAAQAKAAEGPRHPPPVPLSEILGQAGAVGRLTDAFQSGRLHHAWIFHGPQSVGKFTAALAFAALLLDDSSAVDLSGTLAPDPASRCQALLKAGTHPDLHVVVKELARFSEKTEVRGRKLTTIPVEVVREFLIERAWHKPELGLHGVAAKVLIVDEAELMASAAQNALLKTLEEPPPDTVIVLVTANEERLLPTIRSRCQRVAFVRLDHDSMRSWVSRSGLQAPPDELAWAIGFAEGSPGAAAEAVASGLYAWHRELAPMLDAAASGDLPLSLGSTMAGFADGWAKSVVDQDKQASKDTANRNGARRVLRLVAAHARSRLHHAAASGGGALERSALAVDAITRAEARLASNVPFGFVLEGLAADLADAGAGTLA